MSGYFGYPTAVPAYGAQPDAAAAAAAAAAATAAAYPMVPMATQTAFVQGAYSSVYGTGTGSVTPSAYSVQQPVYQQPQPAAAYVPQAPLAAVAPLWQSPTSHAVATLPTQPVYGSLPIMPVRSGDGLGGLGFYSQANMRTFGATAPSQQQAMLHPRDLTANNLSSAQPTRHQYQQQGAPRPLRPPPTPNQVSQPVRMGTGTVNRSRFQHPFNPQQHHQHHQQQQQQQRPQLQQQPVKSNLLTVSVDSTKAAPPAVSKTAASTTPAVKTATPATQNSNSNTSTVKSTGTPAGKTPGATLPVVKPAGPTRAPGTAPSGIGSAANRPMAPNFRAPMASSAASASKPCVAASNVISTQLAGAVGLEYLVQIRTDLRGGASLQYHCRLCDCRFTDPQARDMHVKGRRHRLMYKRKVDPRLDVDAKPSIKARRTDGVGSTVGIPIITGPMAAAAAAAAEAAARARRLEEQRLRELQALEWSNFTGCRTIGFWGGGSGPNRRPETNDDRHVLAKHSSVYPTEADLQSVQQLVTRCERALKLVSDQLRDEEDPAPLRGVMRVGVLAKGLLLHGDLSTQLVLLCANRPTRSLRDRILHLLPDYLQQAAETDYKKLQPPTPNVDGDGDQPPDELEQQTLQTPSLEVRFDEDEGSILVVSAEGDLACSVTLTSPSVREEPTDENPEPEDMLDKEKCLEALAALRQAKWFQAKASSLQPCVVVVRVLRDLCQRLPVWNPLPEWAMELLVERCISSAESSLSPGEALRRVMESLATGILLPGGPGIRDPCEKAPVDAAATLTVQEREDLTAAAQSALRLIAFRQVHRVLDMEPLTLPSAAQAASNFSSPSKAPAATASTTPASAAAVSTAVKRPAPPVTASSQEDNAASPAAGAPPKQPRLP